MTEEKCSKIAKFAFNYARNNGRKKVTSIHKANIMLVLNFHIILRISIPLLITIDFSETV